jgi:hypothetical protein
MAQRSNTPAPFAALPAACADVASAAANAAVIAIKRKFILSLPLKWRMNLP